MNVIQLTSDHLMPGADDVLDTFLGRHHYDHLVRQEPTTVLKPDGRVLLVYVPDVISRDLGTLALRAFRSVPSDSRNRIEAAGGKPTNTGLVGFYDRDPRVPFCRRTKFARDNWGKFQRTLPFIQRASEVFAQFAPDRFAAQQRFIDTVSPDFRIEGSVFTTVTVNDTWRTAAHTDSGDFRDGFGVMTVVERGRYRGGELIFPKFRTAVDIRKGGVLLADVHELHGNAPIVGITDPFTRMSFVFYAREGMRKCGTRREEFERGQEKVA